MTRAGVRASARAHRFSYSVDDTIWLNVVGRMSRSSRSLYMLCLNTKRWYLRSKGASS